MYLGLAECSLPESFQHSLVPATMLVYPSFFSLLHTAQDSMYLIGLLGAGHLHCPVIRLQFLHLNIKCTLPSITILFPSTFEASNTAFNFSKLFRLATRGTHIVPLLWFFIHYRGIARRYCTTCIILVAFGSFDRYRSAAFSFACVAVSCV